MSQDVYKRQLLGKMQKEGYIELEEQDERRKTYALTDRGRNALKQEYQRLQTLVEDGKKVQVEHL